MSRREAFSALSRLWRCAAGCRWARLTLAAVAGLGLIAVSLVAAWATAILEPPRALKAMVRPDGAETIKLVAVYESGETESSFLNGVRLAVDEINAGNGFGGLPLELKVVPEQPFSAKSSLEDVAARSLELAATVAKEDNLLAVVGHEWSATAVPASSVYNRKGVLFLATHATASSLTNRAFDYVFELQPTNAEDAALMAHYALSNGLRRFIVLSDTTHYGLETSNFFTSWASKNGGEIVFRGYLASHLRSVDRLMLFLLENDLFSRQDFDAIYIVSSSSSDTAEFIKRARQLGIEVPILGSDYIFHTGIENYVGKARMKDVVGVSLYDRDSLSATALSFARAYYERYREEPDLTSALGYDAVKLLDDAAEAAGTRDAGKLADALRVARYERPFSGVTGPLVFDAKGLITDTQVYIVRHDGKRFRTVESYRNPMDWGTFDPPTSDPVDAVGTYSSTQGAIR